MDFLNFSQSVFNFLIPHGVLALVNFPYLGSGIIFLSRPNSSVGLSSHIADRMASQPTAMLNLIYLRAAAFSSVAPYVLIIILGSFSPFSTAPRPFGSCWVLLGCNGAYFGIWHFPLAVVFGGQSRIQLGIFPPIASFPWVPVGFPFPVHATI